MLTGLKLFLAAVVQLIGQFRFFFKSVVTMDPRGIRSVRSESGVGAEDESWHDCACPWVGVPDLF